MPNNSQNKTAELGAAESIANDAVRHALRFFSGRISHDFNNMLTMLMAYPQLIRRDLEEDSQGHELLDVLEQNVEHMADISMRLAKFATKTVGVGAGCELDEIVRDVLVDLDDSRISAGVSVISELNSDAMVAVPKDALCSIIEELFVNACEAVHGSGRVRVVTDCTVIRQPAACLGGTAAPGKYARIKIIDSGEGISDADLTKAIEPFFTINKRNKARGSGLGLSIVFAILRDYNGCMFADKTEDGFAITVLLPLFEDGNKSTKNRDFREDPGSGPRILVVDDEDDITSLFQLMLEAEIQNSKVDVAHNGAEALDAFKKKRHDAIVMDLHMPIMDGHTAFNKLAEFCTKEGIDMPTVVFCTGYIPPKGIRQVVADNSIFCLLQKPVNMRELVDTVKKNLPHG